MASRTVEIILKASDQFSDATKKLQLQMAAAKIAADELDKSVQNLQKKHPGLSLDEAQVAAKALQDAKRGADEAGKSFANANIAARGLSQEFGFTLPRAVTQFLSQSKLIGPALSAAFSTVAVFGMIEALGQIPKAIDKLSEAFTGFDQKAKENFDKYHDETVKAIEDTVKFRAHLLELATVSINPFVGPGLSLAYRQQAQKDFQEQAKSDVANAETAVGKLGGKTSYTKAAGVGGALGLAAKIYGEFDEIEGKSLAEWKATLDKAREDSKAAAKLGRDLEEESKTLAAESVRVGAEALAAERRALKNINIGGPGLQGLPGVGGLFPTRPLIVPSYDPMTGEAHFPALDAQGRIDIEAEQQYEFQKRLNDTLDSQRGVGAGIPLGAFATGIPQRELITPQYLRSGAIHYPATLPGGGQIDPFAEMRFEEMQKKQQTFVDGFKKASGQVWDAFFSQGSDVLTRLADLAKSWLKDIGQTLFSNFATGLVFGRAGGSSLFGGGLLGGLLGKVGSRGPWSEAIPGMSGLGGGLLGAAGGLLGGPLGAGTSMGTGALSGVVVSAPAGGIMGALGLGGGAGLLGLGAATIPVIGGIAAGAALIAMEIFGHHHDAPFTRDPNAIQNTREYLFYSGVQDFAKASKDMLDFTHQLNTLPTGTLVKQGLPVALASSNQFRRDVSATLLQDH